MKNNVNSLRTLAAVTCIVLFGFVAYSNSFNGEFVFDDIVNIVKNPSIKNIGSIEDILRAPLGAGVAGRPIINLSLAVNYAISGEKVWSYHLFNLLVHILAAITLFGILRISFSWETLPERYRAVSTEISLAISLVWMLHPLQTQSVTYIIQRCESLMGLFFFLSLYCAIRGWKSTNQGTWHLASLMAFFLGIGSKEVIVAVPVMVFLYDIIFCRYTPKESLLRSRVLYAGFIIGLVLLAFQVAGGGTAVSGPFEVDFTPLQYAITQCYVISHYIRLAFWPDELCLDYNWTIAEPGEVFPYVIFILALAFFTIRLVFRKKPLGFTAAWFFVALSPTSSIMILNEIIAEHRMYLPLAGLVTVVVVGGYEAFRYMASRCRYLSMGVGVSLLAVVVVVLTVLTFNRNADYESRVSIWSDTMMKQPLNARAKNNLGSALFEHGKYRESVPLFYEAMKIKPDFVLARKNLSIVLNKIGYDLVEQGKIEEAIAKFQEAVKLVPDNFEAQKNLAIAFIKTTKYEKAISSLRAVEATNQNNPDYQFFFANTLLNLGKPLEAIPYYLKVFRLKNDYPEAHNNFAIALSKVGDRQNAIVHFMEELKIQPNNASVHSNLGSALVKAGKKEKAIPHFREAIKINPYDEKTLSNLAIALFEMDRRTEAHAYFQEALKINPNNTSIRKFLSDQDGE